MWGRRITFIFDRLFQTCITPPSWNNTEKVRKFWFLGGLIVWLEIFKTFKIVEIVLDFFKTCRRILDASDFCTFLGSFKTIPGLIEISTQYFPTQGPERPATNRNSPVRVDRSAFLIFSRIHSSSNVLAKMFTLARWPRSILSVHLPCSDFWIWDEFENALKESWIDLQGSWRVVNKLTWSEENLHSWTSLRKS